MKLPTILYTGAILSIFAVHYLTEVVHRTNLYQQKEQHPQIEAFFQKLEDVIDTHNSPVIEKAYTGGYINRVSVNPGFRIIHDPTLGREIKVKGPAAALAELRLFERTERFSPDFRHPVRLSELVEVRLNLHRHGSQHLRIQMNRPTKKRTALQPDFVTAGPLAINTLFLTNIPNHPIQIAGKDLIIYTRNDTRNLHGSVERLEIQYEIPRIEGQQLEAPNLNVGELILTERSFF
ncbi:MAG: hypothetical protein AAF840_01150 [Bacteroidota bacterium]